MCELTGPAESEVVGYYGHAEVCSLTGTLRACATERGGGGGAGHIQLTIPESNEVLIKWLQRGTMIFDGK